MRDVPGIVVTGASGRMGRMLVRAVVEATGRARLVGAIVREGHPWVCLLYTSPSPRDS